MSQVTLYREGFDPMVFTTDIEEDRIIDTVKGGWDNVTRIDVAPHQPNWAAPDEQPTSIYA